MMAVSGVGGRAIIVTVEEEESAFIKQQCHNMVMENISSSDTSVAQTDTVVLRGSEGMTCTEQLIHLLRKYCLHDNDRQTILSQEDSLNMLQLCLAEQNKKKFGSFDVEASTVLSATQQLTEHKLSGSMGELEDDMIDVLGDYRTSLQSSNTMDILDVISKVRQEANNNSVLQNEIRSTQYVIYKPPVTRIEKEVLGFLLQEHNIELALAEVPLAASQTEVPQVNVIYENVNDLQEALTRVASIKTARPSITESYAEKVIMSYLELLVNSRNEIALARIIDIPSRGLDHKAFTDLKHVSKPKNMSMYQTAVSHVMRIRLGGKSYAPGAENPLTQHTKGLAELVDLIQKLQAIVEEETNTGKAICRVLNVIKSSIVNHKDNTLRKQSVEAVIERLQAKADKVHTFVQAKTDQSPPKSAGLGGSMLGRMTVKVIRYLLDAFISLPPEGNLVDYLSDNFSSQKTPVRFPCLLSQFRSPMEASPECISNKSLVERVANRIKPKQKSGVPRFNSCMDWAMPVHDSGFNKNNPLTIDDFVPSKTIMHPAENAILPKVARPRTAPESRLDQENIDLLMSLTETADTTSSSNKDSSACKAKTDTTKSKPQKRPMQSFQSSDSQAKKSKKSTGPKASKKKVLSMSKGQTQLTAFFRI